MQLTGFWLKCAKFQWCERNWYFSDWQAKLINNTSITLLHSKVSEYCAVFFVQQAQMLNEKTHYKQHIFLNFYNKNLYTHIQVYNLMSSQAIFLEVSHNLVHA